MNIQLCRQWPFLRIERQQVSQRAIGWIALSILLLCASTYNTFAKSLSDALSPVTLVLLSEALTGFFVLLSFGTVPTLRGLLRLPVSSVPYLLLVGLLSGVIGPFILFLGLEHTSAINATFFGNTEMVFLTIFAVIFLHESLERKHLYSILTIVAGLLVIALKGFSEELIPRLGDFLIILSCASYAGGAIVFRRYLHNCPPHLVIVVRAMCGVAAFFIISPFVSHPFIAEIASFPPVLIPVLLGFGFISRFLNLFSFYEAMEHLPVTLVSLSLNLTVLGSIGFATWLLHEHVEPYHIVGGVLILAGALLLELAGIHPTEKHLERHLQQGNMKRM